jgi:hypothetical protein
VFQLFLSSFVFFFISRSTFRKIAPYGARLTGRYLIRAHGVVPSQRMAFVQIVVDWVDTPCRPVGVLQCFGGPCRLNLQGMKQYVLPKRLDTFTCVQSVADLNIVPYLLNARIVKPVERAVASERLCKQGSGSVAVT